MNITFERKIVNIFSLILTEYVLGAFDYAQHMFWLGNKNNNFPLRILLGPVMCYQDNG